MMVMDIKKAGVCLAQLITGGNANRLKELNCKRNNDPSLIRYIDEGYSFSLPSIYELSGSIISIQPILWIFWRFSC